MNALPIPQYR